MAGSVGFGLLKSVVEGSTPFSEMSEKGISEDFFIGDEKRAFRFIRDYFAEFGNFPTTRTVSLEIGDTNCFEALPNEVQGYWINKLKERRRFHISQSGLRKIRVALEENHIEDAVSNFGSVYSQLQTTYSEFKAIGLKEAESKVIEQHHKVQQMASMPGIPFGFPYIDGISGGAQPGDSIVIAGVTGSGKTYLSLKCALSGFYHGYNILYHCTEMPEPQVSRRLLAMEGSFSTTDLKLGTLSAFAVSKASRLARSSIHIDGERQNNYFKILPGGVYSNLEDIRVMVNELRPHLLVIDGASLVRLPTFRGSRWERMIEVMEQVKAMAMNDQIATISTYHFNKQAPGTVEGMYGGLAMGQLASIVFGFEFERKEDRESPNPVQYRLLKLLKGRDGESGTIRVLYDMLRSRIEQERVLSGYASIEEGESGSSMGYVDDEPYLEI